MKENVLARIFVSKKNIAHVFKQKRKLTSRDVSLLKDVLIFHVVDVQYDVAGLFERVLLVFVCLCVHLYFSKAVRVCSSF